MNSFKHAISVILACGVVFSFLAFGVSQCTITEQNRNDAHRKLAEICIESNGTWLNGNCIAPRK